MTAGGLAPRARRPFPSRPALRTSAIALTVCSALLGWQAVSAAAAQRDTEAALAAARERVGEVLSYRAHTLDADQARGRRATTGEFTREFDRMSTTVVEPTARAQGTVTSATVVRVGLINARPDQVESLLFVDQTTTTAASPAPQVSAAQLRVTMRKVNGVWLIAGLVPL